MPFGFHLAMDTLPSGVCKWWLQVRLGCIRLSSSCPFRHLHTFHFSGQRGFQPRFWIRRSSSERRRDFNPPDLGAAQRTLRTHPPSASVGAGPHGFAVGEELPLIATIADFPCCALLMSRACCHHYPGGIAGCVARSLHRRQRPSPSVWRVGSHIDCFSQCSLTLRPARSAVPL